MEDERMDGRMHGCAESWVRGWMKKREVCLENAETNRREGVKQVGGLKPPG